MSPARRLAEVAAGLHRVLGGPGLMIALFSIVSFVFGLFVVGREYNRPRAVGRQAMRALLYDWVRAPDYLGRVLFDQVDDFCRAPAAKRAERQADLQAALEKLGDELDHYSDRFRLIQLVALDLGDPGARPVARWRPYLGSVVESDRDLYEPFLVPCGSRGKDYVLTVRYRLIGGVGLTALGLESSYRRLLLALLGLSGYSLLCLGYMMLHARALRDRVARESAREATLDLADRTCHELGNGVFVLANERRNLADHLDLVERFLTEEPQARAAAARRAGLDLDCAGRYDHALRRELAARGLDPSVELRQSAEIARDVCRQIGVCSEYIGMTVRELDGYLKHSALPVALETVNVDEGFDEALALLGPKLHAAEVNVDRPPPGSAPIRVRADRRLLIHALVNLIKNAIEATAADGHAPAIILATHVEGPTAWIEVADNGPGIPGADPERVFDDHFTTKGPRRGRGLAIVREATHAQGGRIAVASRPGRGATFRIGLPLVDGTA